MDGNNEFVIFFIHGMFSAGNDVFGEWKEFYDAKGYSTRILDCQQHTMKLRIHSVEHAVASLSADKKVILIGHSLGGFIAQKVAEKYSDRIVGTILLMSATPDRANNVTCSLFMKFMRLSYFRSILFSDSIHMHKKDLSNLLLNNVLKEKRSAYLDKLRPIPNRIALASLFLTMLHRVREENIHHPILVIGGKKDHMLPIHIQRSIAEKYNAEFWETEHGHMPMWEEESLKFFGKIDAWIAQYLINNA